MLHCIPCKHAVKMFSCWCLGIRRWYQLRLCKYKAQYWWFIHTEVEWHVHWDESFLSELFSKIILWASNSFTTWKSYLYSVTHNHVTWLYKLDAYTGVQETSVSVKLEQFGSDGVMTTLEWTQENSLFSYYVTVTPDMRLWINGSANVNLELRIPYNIIHCTMSIL